MRLENVAIAALVATTLATALILYEDNETNSSANIVEDVSWWRSRSLPCHATPPTPRPLLTTAPPPAANPGSIEKSTK